MQAIALNCTLKSSGKPSSTELLLRQVLDALAQHGVRARSSASPTTT